MSNWKRIMVTATIFAVMALAAYAAKGDRKGKEGGGAADRAKQAQVAATLAAKMVGSEMGLTAEKNAQFAEAYAAETNASAERLAEARKTGTPEARKTTTKANQEKLMAVLETHVGADKAKQAMRLLKGSGAENSIRVLLQAKVNEAKVEQALPVLASYHKESMTTRGKGGKKGGGDTPEVAAAKRKELCEATAAKLAPIVGATAAEAWKAKQTAGPEAKTKAPRTKSERPAKKAGDKAGRKGARAGKAKPDVVAP